MGFIAPHGQKLISPNKQKAQTNQISKCLRDMVHGMNISRHSIDTLIFVLTKKADKSAY
jgi:hypothetical protein